MVGPRLIKPAVIRYGTKEEIVEAFKRAGYDVVSTSLPAVEYGVELRKRVNVREELRLEDYATVEIYTTVPKDLNVIMRFPLMRRDRYESNRHQCDMSYEITKEGLVPRGIKPFGFGA
jgi:hypothetical protein